MLAEQQTAELFDQKYILILEKEFRLNHDQVAYLGTAGLHCNTSEFQLRQLHFCALHYASLWLTRRSVFVHNYLSRY